MTRPCKDCGYLPCQTCCGDWAMLEDRTTAILGGLNLVFNLVTFSTICYLLHQTVLK